MTQIYKKSWNVPSLQSIFNKSLMVETKNSYVWKEGEKKQLIDSQTVLPKEAKGTWLLIRTPSRDRRKNKEQEIENRTLSLWIHKPLE